MLASPSFSQFIRFMLRWCKTKKKISMNSNRLLTPHIIIWYHIHRYKRSQNSSPKIKILSSLTRFFLSFYFIVILLLCSLLLTYVKEIKHKFVAYIIHVIIIQVLCFIGTFTTVSLFKKKKLTDKKTEHFEVKKSNSLSQQFDPEKFKKPHHYPVSKQNIFRSLVEFSWNDPDSERLTENQVWKRERDREEMLLIRHQTIMLR